MGFHFSKNQISLIRVIQVEKINSLNISSNIKVNKKVLNLN